MEGDGAGEMERKGRRRREGPPLAGSTEGGAAGPGIRTISRYPVTPGHQPARTPDLRCAAHGPDLCRGPGGPRSPVPPVPGAARQHLQFSRMSSGATCDNRTASVTRRCFKALRGGGDCGRRSVGGWPAAHVPPWPPH